MILKRLNLILVLLIMVVWSDMLFAEYKNGETYHGFKLIEKRFVKEVNAECLLFEHVQSGARLIKIADDDPNKTFSIAFKTLPESDAGTPHIMEHSVLNGSRNFPVKSPFDVLAKGSLNTFLNAMTGSHITIYPVASMNDKDYFNLMHIYLDAVFHPLIYDDPRILKQEGWHHELTGPEAPVEYKGVVYNEMKGAFSSPSRELGYQIDKNLFPDNCYVYSSGGYPTATPTLTYDDFLNFHRKYYHPSNSYIFLYGNADVDKELEFINREYLSSYNKSDAVISIPVQKPFEKMKEITGFYPVSESGNIKDQTYLTLSYVSGLCTDRTLVMALDILSEVLVNQESAPVRLALQEAGIGKEVSGSVDELKQNVFQISVQNANAEDMKKFHEVVMKTLKDVIKKGLDQEAVQGTLNRIEFSLREGNDAQKGLTYNFRTLSGWFFANDPFLSLEYENTLTNIKKEIKKGYLEKVIQKYLVENPHALLLSLQPKPGLESEINEQIAAELESYKASLSPDEAESLVKETSALVEYQKQEDTPEALAAIPMLELKDINPVAEWYTVSSSLISDVPALQHESFTNDVVYTSLYFDARVLPKELIPYAALLAEIMGSMNTENYTYGELDKALNLHTGGFSSSLATYLEYEDDNNLMPKFVVSSKSMNSKVGKMFELVGEIVKHSRYGDTERLKAVLTRHQSRLDASIKRDGIGYAMKRMTSYYSNEGMFNELTEGAEYYWFITDLLNDFDDKSGDIIANLNKTAELLLSKNNLIVSVTGAKSDLPVFSKNFAKFVKLLPEKKPEYNKWSFTFEKKNEGLLTASKVQYVLQGYDYKKLGYKWDGKLRVLTQILSRDFLQTRIRVLGGAYGGFSSFSSDGRVYFASYRDPNLRETLVNFDAIPEFMKTFEADDQTMTRFIIGTVARMDKPLTPSQKGALAVKRYFEKTTKDDLQKERSAVLSVTPADIRSMEKMVSEVLAQDAFCVYGNEDKIESEKDIFGKIIPLNR
ncbi:MAG: insulinase family protein [Calditrichaceae bacterium]